MGTGGPELTPDAAKSHGGFGFCMLLGFLIGDAAKLENYSAWKTNASNSRVLASKGTGVVLFRMI